MTSEIAEMYTCNIYYHVILLKFFTKFVFMHFWIFNAAACVYIVIDTYLGSQIANLMLDFCE